MRKKAAPEEKAQGGARTAFTDEHIAGFKAKLLELIPQGKTLRQILAEPDMCSMTYLFRELLPNDKQFSEQYARVFELRNDYWAEDRHRWSHPSRLAQLGSHLRMTISSRCSLRDKTQARQHAYWISAKRSMLLGRQNFGKEAA